MKYSIPVLLLFILFSCKPDTEKIIPGKWNLTKSSNPILDKFAEKLGQVPISELVSLHSSKDFFHFYNDGSFTSIWLGHFIHGKWKWDKNSESIILSNSSTTDSLKVIETASSKLILQKKLDKQGFDFVIQMTLEKDRNVSEHEKDDYTSLYNNQWRIKPDSLESYDDLVKRVRGAVHFAVLYLSDAGKGDKGTMDAVPLPVLLTPHGMRILEENEIGNNWKAIFFNDNNAIQAYHIFKDAIPSEPFTKGNTGIPMLAGLLRRTEPNIR